MPWLLPNGTYYDTTDHVAEGSLAAQEEPATGNPILIDDPRSNPMNCWREKRQDEIDAEKTVEAGKLKNPKKAHAAVMEIIWENSSEMQTAFPDGGTPGNGKKAFKRACVDQYQSKL